MDLCDKQRFPSYDCKETFTNLVRNSNKQVSLTPHSALVHGGRDGTSHSRLPLRSRESDNTRRGSESTKPESNSARRERDNARPESADTRPESDLLLSLSRLALSLYGFFAAVIEGENAMFPLGHHTITILPQSNRDPNKVW